MAGHGLWRKDDPVHLTEEAYGDLANAVRDTVLSGPVADSVSAAGSDKEGRKRKIPESIVTRQPLQQHKKGRGAVPVRPAGWLFGRIEQEQERGGNARGRASCSGGHGHRAFGRSRGYGLGGGWRGGWPRGRRPDARR